MLTLIITNFLQIGTFREYSSEEMYINTFIILMFYNMSAIVVASYLLSALPIQIPQRDLERFHSHND